VLRRLGSGGVASVFLAEDERLRRKVAVKRLHAGRAEEMAERFEREARLGASLNHPNLVAVYDITADAEAVIIVMEYVEGETLADALRAGPMQHERAITILREVAAGLDHAHTQGVVHRDVKPANVLIGAGGRVKVADLGIATAAEMTNITRSGMVLGTPSYMAPEQLEGAPAGPTADVYALAAVAFEALAGRKARGGGTPLEVAHRVATEPPPDIREAWPDAPPALAETLRAGMAADPHQRPRSAGDLVGQVSSTLAAGAPPAQAPSADEPQEPTDELVAHPVPAPSRRDPGSGRGSRGRWAAVAAVALLGLGVLAATLLLIDDRAAPDGSIDQADQAPTEAGASDAGGDESADASAEAAPAEAAPAAPEEAVTSFYESAAAGDYDSAWSLATPRFREQLGGLAAFQQQQSTLESIEFEQAEVVEEGEGSAQVDISTVATHTDYVENCEGTLRLVSDGGAGWLIDEAENISCTPT
jgi:serine/threonine-protein kinase